MRRKAGVLINPTSGRGNGKGPALAEKLRGNSSINLQLLTEFGRLKPILQEMTSAGVTDLFISSGDGTIQAIQTLLAESRIFPVLPRLCILPHGTTNLTAIDIGFSQQNLAQQAAYILSLPPPKTTPRHSLRIINPETGDVRHGMTLGSGAAARATRLTQTDFNDRGQKGQLAAFKMMAGAIGKTLFTKPAPGDMSRLDRPCQMLVTSTGKQIVNGPQLMFIATTLERQFFNTRPFWGGKVGAIRASVFPHPVPNLVRWLLPLMYGGENRKVPNGAVSFSCDSFEIACNEPYVMDGEFFEGPETEPLRVETGPLFEFITG